MKLTKIPKEEKHERKLKKKNWQTNKWMIEIDKKERKEIKKNILKVKILS